VDELVDVELTVATVTTFYEVLSFRLEPPTWRRQLEGPQHFVHFPEARSTGVYLVNEVLNANELVLSESLLDQVVVKLQPLPAKFDVASLVHQVTNHLV
jgi:hypothetical protein